MAFGGGLHRFPPLKRDPAGAARGDGGQRHVGLYRQVELAAETAADRRGHDADVGGGAAKDQGHRVAVHYRRLRAGVDMDAAVDDLRETGLGFDIAVFDEGGREGAAGCDTGPGEGRIGIAALHETAAHDVARMACVQQRRAGRHRGVRSGERRQFLPGHREGGGIEAGHGRGLAHHGGDGFAAVAGGGFGEHRLVLKGGNDAKGVLAGNVGGSQHHQPQCNGVGDGEARVCVRRPDEFHHQRARRRDVVAERFGAVELCVAVQTRDRAADGAVPCQRRLVSGHRIARAHHGVDDLAIPGASAQHAAEGILDLRFGRDRRCAQKRDGADHHPRRADAALGGLMAREIFRQTDALRRMAQGARGLDVAARRAVGGHQAGAMGGAVDQHGAGAAIARVAADLDVAGAQPVAQGLRQTFARFRFCADARAIEGERQRCGAGAVHQRGPTKSASARAAISATAARRYVAEAR